MEAALEPIHRLSVEDVFGMLEAGVLSGDDRLELIDGILLDVPPAGESHSSLVDWLTERFVRLRSARNGRCACRTRCMYRAAFARRTS